MPYVPLSSTSGPAPTSVTTGTGYIPISTGKASSGYQPISTVGKLPSVEPMAATSTPRVTPTSSSASTPAFSGKGYSPAAATDTFTSKPLARVPMKIPKTFASPETAAEVVDTSRTAPTIDPTKAQPIDKGVLKNGRMPSDVSAKIKASFDGTSAEQLDHLMPLELGGSNDKSNLHLEPTIKGVNTATDPLENKLTADVYSGKISLVDAWRQMAKAKGVTLTEDKALNGPVDNFLLNSPKILKPLASAQETIQNAPKNWFDFIAGQVEKNPITKFLSTAQVHGITQAIQGAVADTPLPAVPGASKTSASNISGSLNADQINTIIARRQELIAKGVNPQEATKQATIEVRSKNATEPLDNAVMGSVGGESGDLSKAKGALGDLAKAGKDVPAVESAINTSKLNISKRAEQTIAQTAQEIKPELESIKGTTLTNQEVINAAKEASILTKATSRQATLESESALLRTRQHLAALAEGKTVTPEFVDTLRTISAEATKRGRELQSLGISADPSLGTVKTKLVQKLLRIGIDTNAIVRAAEGVDFTNAEQVTKFYRQFVKPTLPEVIDEYRYINLLSSPKTHIVNAFSNILQASVLDPATKLASGVIDPIASALTGAPRKAYIAQVPAYYRGAFSSIGEATSKALSVLRGNSLIERPDIKTIPTGSKILKPFQLVPRLLEASDVFFRSIIEGGEKEALALRYAKAGRAVNSAQIAKEAAAKAEYYVFRKAIDPSNKTGQGAVLSGIDKMTNAVYKLRDVPGMKWFIPFVQTPMNILKQGIEYSPAGFATTVGNTAKAEQVAKATIGSMIFAGSGYLAMNEMTTWAVPTNPKQKEAFYAAGLQPYSIKVGDNWIQYSRLGPIAYPMAMAAAIKYYTQENPKAVTQTTLERTTATLSAIAQFFSDQSYMQGLGDFVDLTNGDNTALNRIATNMPSQLIPLESLQRWIANLIDPVYRNADRSFSLTGIVQNLEKGLPMLSKNVPAYQTITGGESTRQLPVVNSVSPLSVTTEDPAMKGYFDATQASARANAVQAQTAEQTKQRAQQAYEQAQTLLSQGKRDQAQSLIESLTDQEYKAYQTIKANAAGLSPAEIQFAPTYREIRDLISQEKTAEAQGVLDGLSDSQYKLYQSLKKRGL